METCYNDTDLCASERGLLMFTIASLKRMLCLCGIVSLFAICAGCTAPKSGVSLIDEEQYSGIQIIGKTGTCKCSDPILWLDEENGSVRLGIFHECESGDEHDLFIAEIDLSGSTLSVVGTNVNLYDAAGQKLPFLDTDMRSAVYSISPGEEVKECRFEHMGYSLSYSFETNEWSWEE